MYSSSQNGYQRFNPPPPLAPPPNFNQSRMVNGVSVNASAPPGVREIPWSSGLCDCHSDISNCCLTCWCPCITFGLVSETVDKRGSSYCIGNGIIYSLLASLGCCCIYSYYYRLKMRRQYLLLGSPCGDFLLHCFCGECALCQEYRELKSRGYNMSLGCKAADERLKQGAMTAPAVQAGMHR